MGPQFLGGNFDNFVVAPNIDRMPVPSVLFHDFLNGCLERHLGSLDQRQFKNICGRPLHFSPSRLTSSMYCSISIIQGLSSVAYAMVDGIRPELLNKVHESARTLKWARKFLIDLLNRRRTIDSGTSWPPFKTRSLTRDNDSSTGGNQR